jgi:hypothetical protein
MIHRKLLRILMIVVILTTSAVALAGTLQLIGHSTWAPGSLIVNGTASGLVTSGVSQATVRFVGYGHCFNSFGAYWTPTDPNQMDDDPYLADDYPEIRLILPAGTNKFDFSMELPNPGAPGSNVPYPGNPLNPSPIPTVDYTPPPPDAMCASTWVWTGASLQLWSSNGAALISLFDQQNFTCSLNTKGTFDCK